MRRRDAVGGIKWRPAVSSGLIGECRAGSSDLLAGASDLLVAIVRGDGEGDGDAAAGRGTRGGVCRSAGRVGGTREQSGRRSWEDGAQELRECRDGNRNDKQLDELHAIRRVDQKLLARGPRWVMVRLAAPLVCGGGEASFAMDRWMMWMAQAGQGKVR